LTTPDFLVMIGAFTAGLSVLLLVIAGAVKWVGGSRRGAAPAVRELHEEVELLRGEIDRLRNSVEQTTRPPELDDIQSRLDFAERLLAQMKTRDTLPRPR
jgi:hypothetical protein